MLIALITICFIFAIYEIALHNFYKKDIKEEKLISFFSNARMQLMKMIYMKEITPDSNYFNFMIRATSYSIKTIYYRKNKLSLEQLNCIKEMLNFLNTDNLKNEFKALNGEQKELFAKTVLKILELYFNADFSTKILWKLYLLKISCKMLEVVLCTLEKLIKFVDTKEKDSISYINDIETSYSLRQYAFA